MINHSIKMLLGCLVPLALIFILPLFGVGEGITLVVFTVLMLGCHMMMMGGHGHGKDDKEENHESH